jgi:hypothetical protein
VNLKHFLIFIGLSLLLHIVLLLLAFAPFFAPGLYFDSPVFPDDQEMTLTVKQAPNAPEFRNLSIPASPFPLTGRRRTLRLRGRKTPPPPVPPMTGAIQTGPPSAGVTFQARI